MDRQRWRNMDLNQALAFFDAMEDDGFSGEESFLTDEELDYQNGLDPAEDHDIKHQIKLKQARRPPMVEGNV
ncbi:hypothetical protein R3I93_003289 [Phoxinus phoxinus]|uniref:Uncharacterized protein n=1 Tax=Phoxinus phoxinus TaxID=58324 RepID=A0AAN9DIU5_9TELE